MLLMIDDSKPIFMQIAELIENGIVDGSLAEESQVPSTNEFAAFHRINPATAAKGVNVLVDSGILYKRRGIGMFVATGARANVIARRTEEFFEQYVKPLALEARKLGISKEQLNTMIERSSGLAPDSGTDKERSAAL
ncbi:GntR family transcriptional regulator [Arthrobacter sp. StoSoilB3]|nr:GntR family transcriptional regulator [Arthrobacter sp. Leaf145]QOT22260.1 GntR family transcriptional regulator [Paenarthrobacter sp. YJN-D]BCW11201.1 GntR family transcriptional regulator [Arthrobacter sp. NtRootA2]BCW15283.1 GntR family transcriptional regulator [Arthrobacter sp. NtRootA4]BCW23618.1 GntR family transcriptional regulator [Arthrobacter sp. NtRootC7]BCW27886.1 GntR family transcriptional regulator [Arthrobacter sp. NtRootC45]BCW32156.1 GntR family transcriptional regulator